MPVFEVDRVKVSDAAGAVEVTRDEGSWKRGEDAIDYGPVSDLLYAIDDAKAERIATPGESPQLGTAEIPSAVGSTMSRRWGKPATAMQAPGSARPGSERLELFAATSENLVPVRADGREAVLLMARDARRARRQVAGGARRQGRDRRPDTRSPARPIEE